MVWSSVYTNSHICATTRSIRFVIEIEKQFFRVPIKAGYNFVIPCIWDQSPSCPLESCRVLIYKSPHRNSVPRCFREGVKVSWNSIGGINRTGNHGDCAGVSLVLLNLITQTTFEVIYLSYRTNEKT